LAFSVLVTSLWSDAVIRPTRLVSFLFAVLLSVPLRVQPCVKVRRGMYSVESAPLLLYLPVFGTYYLHYTGGLSKTERDDDGTGRRPDDETGNDGSTGQPDR